jgi:hypothetical protein
MPHAPHAACPNWQFGKCRLSFHFSLVATLRVIGVIGLSNKGPSEFATIELPNVLYSVVFEGVAVAVSCRPQSKKTEINSK